MAIQGTNNNDNLVGTSGNDTIQGLNGNDTLSGLGGNDQLSGGAGSDTLSGGTGKDQFVLKYFNDDLFAKDQGIVTDFKKGEDQVDVKNLGISDFNTILLLTSDDADGNAIINTRYRLYSDNSSYRFKIDGISKSQLQANDFILKSAVVNDTITGTSYNDDLFGGLGNDSLQGDSGNDRLFGEQGDDKLSGGTGSDTLYGGTGKDQFVLKYFNDDLFAKDQGIVTDFKKGEDQVDVKNLGISDFNTILLLTSDDADGNAIINTRYRLYSDNSSYRFKIDGISKSQLQASDFILKSAVVNDTITGTSYNDDLFGGLGNDSLQGDSGNDRLFGEQGDDKLSGGTGSDTLYGGTGKDQFVLKYFNDDLFAKDQGIVTDFKKGEDQVDVKNLGISDFNTILLLTSDDADGNAIINTRYRLYSDNSSYRFKIDGISKSQLQASDFILKSAVVNDTITGTSYNDDLFGGLGNDSLQGDSGNDRLFGEQGDDKLSGGTGSDTLYGGTGKDQFVLKYFNDDLFAKDQGIVTDFKKGEDQVDVKNLGISDFNTILLLTSDDADGNAIINTRYRLYSDNSSYRFKIDGISKSQLQASDFILKSAVVNDTITGTSYNDDLFGGFGNDSLLGDNGNDRLFGEQGDDKLLGGAGDDTLYGGVGNDTYSFLANTALGTDTITETTIGGTDTINFSGTTVAVNLNLGSTTLQTVNSNLKLILSANNVIENVTGGTGNDNLIGNTLNNTLIGGNGNDQLQGLAGNDTYSFFANSALGTDTIRETTTGGTDTINFTGTTVAVNLNLGLTTSQTVNSNLKLILSANNAIENATGGTGNDSLTGNTLNNTLIGSGGNDQLQGLAGNDTLEGGNGNDILTGGIGNDFLWGGLGNDTLTGGVGSDKYVFQGNGVFNTSLGIDYITQFEARQDQIVLSKTTFNAVTNTVGQSLTDFAIVTNDQLVNASKAHIVFSQGSDKLFYNRDGNVLGAGTVFEFARLGNADITLSSSNFSLIA